MSRKESYSKMIACPVKVFSGFAKNCWKISGTTNKLGQFADFTQTNKITNLTLRTFFQDTCVFGAGLGGDALLKVMIPI